MELIPLFDYERSPRGRTQKVVFHLTVRAPQPVSDNEASERAPLNLGLVLDRSGSMSGSKLDYTKDAAKRVIDNLAERDRLSVTIYDDVIETIVKPAPVTQKDRLKKLIDGTHARGCTNLSGGWQRGEEMVRQGMGEVGADAVNRVVLMTDGLANAGITNHDDLVELARSFKAGGITTTAIGFGDDFDEDLLNAVADAGGGNFYYIENPDQAPGIFQEELGELLATVGQDLKLTIRFAPGVKLTEVLNDYPEDDRVDGDPETGGGSVTLRLGDATAGESKVLITELELPAVHDNGPLPVCSLQLDWLSLQPTPERRVATQEVTRPVADPADCENQERNAQVLEDAMLLRIARDQRLARTQADAGQFQAATNTLVGTITALQDASMGDVFAGEIEELQNAQDTIRSGGYGTKVRKQMLSRARAQSRSKGRYKK